MRKGRASSISFQLSKISHVGIVVIGPGGNTLFATSATFGYGTRSFSVPALKHKGTYTIHLVGHRSGRQLQPDRGDDPGVLTRRHPM